MITHFYTFIIESFYVEWNQDCVYIINDWMSDRECSELFLKTKSILMDDLNKNTQLSTVLRYTNVDSFKWMIIIMNTCIIVRCNIQFNQ